MRERQLVFTVGLTLAAASAIWLAPRLHAALMAPPAAEEATADLAECAQSVATEAPTEPVVPTPQIIEVLSPLPPPIEPAPEPRPQATLPAPSTIPELANPVTPPEPLHLPIKPTFWDDCPGCGMG